MIEGLICIFPRLCVIDYTLFMHLVKTACPNKLGLKINIMTSVKSTIYSGEA